MDSPRGDIREVDSFHGEADVVKCIQRASTERLDTTMGKFSETEIRQLRENVNVVLVTEHEIVFTESFKQLAWEGKQKGKKLPEVFRENGIDPSMLGHKRVENFSRRLREMARNNDDFSDNRQGNHRPKQEEGCSDLEAKIMRLQHELAYTKQEVEFLKKIQMANTEARKEWESKHRPK